MGKIRVKVLGDESVESAQKDKADEKREQKDLRQGKSAKVAGMKGGERTVSVGITEEEIAKQLESESAEAKTEGGGQMSEGGRQKAEDRKKKQITSKRHLENKKMAGTSNSNLEKSIETLRKFKKSTFDETVELHVNTKEKGVSGMVTLPHGTGKKLRIKVADDAIITEIEKGKIDFDVLVATPAMMPKLAKVAKILGPKGLMPNPKNGTITDKPEEAVEKLSAGQISFKTEALAPVIHASVGKLSFEDKKLQENISALLSAIGTTKITSITLKSTMSPGIRIKV